MAWTAPRTWVTGETVTAALMNAHIRDNFLETSAATVTTAGDLVYADAANSMGTRLAIGAATTHLVSTGSVPVWRAIATDTDTGSGSTSSTGFLSLANLSDTPFAGEVEVTVTTGTAALVLFKSGMANSGAGNRTTLSYAVSSATTTAASANRSVAFESNAANDYAEIGGHDIAVLTAGSNVFTLAGRVDAGVGTFTRPDIAVIAF
jgi:hypothetical protein